jgi:hypothetical protein
VFRRWHRFVRFARIFVMMLALPIVFERAWPSVVEYAFGAPAHLCHCDVRGGHATCACPVCHPEDADLKARVLAVQGPCGDEDHFVAPDLPPVTVVCIGFGVPAAVQTEVLSFRIYDRKGTSRAPPPVPPPRA